MQTNPFLQIRPWIGAVLHTVKKEIKNDYLPSDRAFYKAAFGSRPLNKLTMEEIVPALEKELLGGNQGLIDWTVNRWVFKHGDIYRHFVEKLSSIDPNFQTMPTLTQEQASSILAGALERFGARDVYLFSRLNGVVLPEESFAELHDAALAESAQKVELEKQQELALSLEQLCERHRRELQRMQEKYEDKMAGLLRKYTIDTEALKKQIRSLQQKALA